MQLGTAIQLAQEGYAIRRAGWNGAGMWVCYVAGSTVDIKEGSPYATMGLQGRVTIDPHMDMYTAQGTMQPGWLASQADLQATDWELAE